MKKIVFRTKNFPAISETFVLGQIAMAIRMGFEVVILVDNKGGINSTSQPNLLEAYGLLDKTYEILPIKIKTKQERLKLLIQTFFKIGFKGLSLFNSVKYGKGALNGNAYIEYGRYYKFLKDADAIHVLFGNAYKPLAKFKKAGLLKSKLITTFLGYDVHFTNDTHKQQINFYKNLFEIGDVFTTITPYIGNQLLALYCPEDRLKILHLPIDVDFFVPKQNPSSSTNDCIELLSVGRLIGWKGHRLGILAVHELLQKGYPIRYTIIGEGPERHSLEALITKLGLKQQIQLLGAKTQDEIRQQMQHSDIFLMTSYYDETGRRETQGVVTGEAQACGLPVVAFNSGGVPYTLKDGQTGFLCEEANYKAMAQKIEILINDVELREQMGNQAVDFIRQNFSLEVLEAQWKVVYNFNTL